MELWTIAFQQLKGSIIHFDTVLWCDFVLCLTVYNQLKCANHNLYSSDFQLLTFASHEQHKLHYSGLYCRSGWEVAMPILIHFVLWKWFTLAMYCNCSESQLTPLWNSKLLCHLLSIKGVSVLHSKHRWLVEFSFREFVNFTGDKYCNCEGLPFQLS